jgi:hypothetical protein
LTDKQKRKPCRGNARICIKLPCKGAIQWLKKWK